MRAGDLKLENVEYSQNGRNQLRFSVIFSFSSFSYQVINHIISAGAQIFIVSQMVSFTS